MYAQLQVLQQEVEGLEEATEAASADTQGAGAAPGQRSAEAAEVGAVHAGCHHARFYNHNEMVIQTCASGTGKDAGTRTNVPL